MRLRLPGARLAQVDTAKVSGYLLNLSHPDGSGKARFFMGFGYDPAHPETLAADLRQHGQAHEVSETVESAYGVRYTVDGELKTPDERVPLIRTIWIIERGSEVPRLITAHPIGRRG
jgi:hypothetical protein